MVTIENLQLAVDASIALVYQKFGLNATDNNKQKLFCFYEGKDAPYYSFRITQIFGDEYLNFTCKNKSNVLKLYNKIKSQKDNFRLAFFIDSDFDQKVNNPEIYETPFYSIENFYASNCCIKKLLKNQFYLNEEDDDSKKIILLYEQEFNNYCQMIIPYNAWYHCLKTKKDRENLPSTNVSLDDKLPNNFLRLEIENLSKNYTVQDIFAHYPQAINVTLTEVNESEQYLLSQPSLKVLRGKFLITFVIKFIEFLVTDSKSGKRYIKQNHNFHTDKTVVIGHLSQYAYTPTCLIDYLNHFKSGVAA